MGQQQLREYSTETIQEKHFKKLQKQVDLLYLDKYFALKTDYSDKELYCSYLMSEVLCTDNCEILRFVNKKIRGALGSENLEITDLKSLQPKYRDINNYYYNLDDKWDKVEW